MTNGNTKTMKRRRPLIDLRRTVTEWLALNAAAMQWGERADAIKVLLRDHLLLDQGDKDEAGHYWYEFDEPIEDPSGQGDVVGVKSELHVKKTFIPEAAEQYLRTHKGLPGPDGEPRTLWDECQETVVYLSEDAVLAANFEKRIPDRVLNTWYEVKENRSWIPQRRTGRKR